MSYLIRPTKTGFRIVEEVREDKKKTVKTVPILAYEALGFFPTMSLQEAKTRAKNLNYQNDTKKIAQAARRLETLKKDASTYLPPQNITKFEKELDTMYFDNPYRLEIMKRYWKAAQLLILDLSLDATDFAAKSPQILQYFKQKNWSHDYIKRITRTLNFWGRSCLGRAYEPLPPLTSVQVQRINDSRDDIEGVRTAADALQWVELSAAKEKFKTEHWNWLFIATWFGLRPLEVDNLKKAKYWRVYYSIDHKCDVLEVYQTKLTSVTKDKRWKPIPVVMKEQKEALQLIHAGDFRRPLNKTLQRIFHEKIQTYSPRKGFVDLMLKRGFALEDISIFLGHSSITMTWRVYKDHMKFKLPLTYTET